MCGAVWTPTMTPATGDDAPPVTRAEEGGAESDDSSSADAAGSVGIGGGTPGEAHTHLIHGDDLAVCCGSQLVEALVAVSSTGIGRRAQAIVLAFARASQAQRQAFVPALVRAKGLRVVADLMENDNAAFADGV